MGVSAKLRVISYDISDDKRRRRVARILEDAGSRVQYSVFEMRLTDRALEKVVERVQIDLGQTDSLRVYTIGQTGERKCQAIGACIPIDKEAGFWLM